MLGCLLLHEPQGGYWVRSVSRARKAAKSQAGLFAARVLAERNGKAEG